MSRMGEGWSGKENPNVFVRVEGDDACHSFDLLFALISLVRFRFTHPLLPALHRIQNLVY